MAMVGGCQCGAVRYEITSAPLTLYCCHCSECQKQSSSAFGMSLWVARDHFRITKGETKVWRRPARATGTMDCHFCPTCGSRIYHRAGDTTDVLSVKAGSLDDRAGLDPIAHIWLRSAQPWFETPDRPLNHATEPDDFDPLTEAWRDREGSG